MISSTPRRLRPSTSFEPMNPAAPVTMKYMSGSEQLLVGGGSGTELADHDTRGAVGKPHRRLEARAGGEHHRERGDHGIAGARDVEHFARLGLHAYHFPPEKRHALLAAREKQRLELELVAQRRRSALQVLVVLPRADHFAQLGKVGR